MDKLFNDNIHGYIRVSDIAVKIIDTPEFQRLRNIKQLGTTNYVFQCATHTRFEHSIGVYYLAGLLLKNIKEKQPELKIEHRLIEIVKIAGLVHDLGHGPFSHLFDDNILKEKIPKHKYCHHENRSIDLFKQIVKKYKIDINNEEQNFIGELINPPKNKIGYIYQIISNPINTIDVDKFDYIARDSFNLGVDYNFNFKRIIEEARVIDNNICFPEKMDYSIYRLFETRYGLHRQVYNNPHVISFELMMTDILKNNSHFDIVQNTLDMEKFYKLDDNILTIIERETKNKQTLELIQRIKTRKIYVYIGEFNNMCDEDKLKMYITDTFKLMRDDILIITRTIGYVSGKKKNPLKSVFFYNKNEPNKIFTKNKGDISGLISNKYQEKLYRIYIKNHMIKHMKHTIYKEILSFIQKDKKI